MVKIGIDFSLNSPGVTILKNDELIFMSFFNTYGKLWDKVPHTKKFSTHNLIKDYVILKPYNRVEMSTKNKYDDEQSLKMLDAKLLSMMIINNIKKYFDDNTIIILEGFSFASSGASYIDLILYNSFLRNHIIDIIGVNNLKIVSPTSVKKLAGKGNANKEYMIKSFINNVLNDEILSNNSFYKFVKNTELDYNNIKPIDDIIDSYFLMRSI